MCLSFDTSPFYMNTGKTRAKMTKFAPIPHMGDL